MADKTAIVLYNCRGSGSIKPAFIEHPRWRSIADSVSGDREYCTASDRDARTLNAFGRYSPIYADILGRGELAKALKEILLSRRCSLAFKLSLANQINYKIV
ncbi:hypothetical protein [Microcoleus sp. B4-D4]|uniref:hypothetical protein n=1 Tax=Microcoleus sp. B4-D4 TaxID=2818667 RepID=UPI002FD63785